MTRRILHITASLDRGGAEKQLSLLAARLPREEFEVHVCALSDRGPVADDLQAAGVPVTVIPARWKFDPLAYWRLERHVRHLRPNLVQTWLFAANAYGRAAALRCGVPAIVASERSMDPRKRGYQFAIDRWLTRRTSAIVVNSGGVRDFCSRHGVPADLLRVIPGGVESSPSPADSRDAILQELRLPAGARLIAAVGRLSRQKRLKDLIWATDLLKVIRDDVHLLIVGDGPQRAALQRYRRLCRVEDRVHFLGLRSDVARLLPHCDLLWLASGDEGISGALLEAMAAGIPVVATDIPGNRDVVVPGENGYLVTVGDRAEFARQANKLLDDPALAQRLGAAGRDRAARDFRVETMVDRYAELYRELLGRAGSRDRRA